MRQAGRKARPQASLPAAARRPAHLGRQHRYAIGRVNFLADPAQQPHLRTDELASLLGVKQTTMANKGRLIMDTLGIRLLDPEYCRGELLDRNPLVWMLEVDGLIVDARWLPEAVQVQAWQRGLIPYVPAQAGGDDPAGRLATRRLPPLPWPQTVPRSPQTRLDLAARLTADGPKPWDQPWLVRIATSTRP